MLSHYPEKYPKIIARAMLEVIAYLRLFTYLGSDTFSRFKSEVDCSKKC